MSYSTTVVIAYGFDASDFQDIPQLTHEDDFDEFCRVHHLKNCLELEMYGDARSGMTPFIKVRGAGQEFETNEVGVLNLPASVAPNGAAIMQQLCNILNIRPNIGWKLYTYTY